jgi:hypothetical protein
MKDSAKNYSENEVQEIEPAQTKTVMPEEILAGENCFVCALLMPIRRPEVCFIDISPAYDFRNPRICSSKLGR